MQEQEFPMNFEAVRAKEPLFLTIHKILPEAVIAGGYLRDLLMDKPTRDLDILTNTAPTFLQVMDLEQALLAYGIHVLFEKRPQWEPGEEEEYKGVGVHTTDILEIWNGAPHGDTTTGVDIIVVSNVSQHIHEFPDNISKVFYGKYGTNGLVCTTPFILGHKDKKIIYNAAAGMPRLEKLQAKYPDYACESALAQIG